jgi:hypothetical protein
MIAGRLSCKRCNTNFPVWGKRRALGYGEVVGVCVYSPHMLYTHSSLPHVCKASPLSHMNRRTEYTRRSTESAGFCRIADPPPFAILFTILPIFIHPLPLYIIKMQSPGQ